MATRELTIQEQLTGFVKRWGDYHSTEIAGAQSYLRHLLECYGADDYEPGEIFEAHPVRVVKPQQGEMFGPAKTVTSAERMDMYIPRICVWEMKGPQENLDDHVAQLQRYWVQTRPRYMVLCNFHEIWVYDTDEPDGTTTPHKYKLQDLPENHEALLFLRGDEAFFPQASEIVTREAARYIGQAVRELIEESDDRIRDRERITKFALECVFAMFGEDTGMIPGNLFENAMKTAQQSGDLSPVYTLFDDFGRANEYDRSNVTAPYINGPLFDREHPKLQVNKSILDVIYTASQYDWTAVRPEVFGSIFEQALDPAMRHELGAHFTAEADIMKVVGPTVVRPWSERIKACKTHKDCEALIKRMKHYHVLDPACGSGNFLYIVLREMKRLERALMNKWEERYNTKYGKRKADRRKAPKGPYFTVDQLHGIDKEEVAVQLTRVVLWIGQHLASRESDTEEASLPLTDLSANIIKADALFSDWFRPEDDGVSELAIVGNPPFLGAKRLRQELGDEYVDAMYLEYPNNKSADLVTFWYPTAVKLLKKNERAGFVSTNSIAQNESREASLDLIYANGGKIYDAWSSYVWPGEAAVHVSIVNWIMSDRPITSYLDGKEVTSISRSLSDFTDTCPARIITLNADIAFQGVKPGSVEFMIDGDIKNKIIESDPISSKVIKPILVAKDLNRRIDQSNSRWVIDFNDMTEEEATKHPGAMSYVVKNVVPSKLASRQSERLKKLYWQFESPRPGLRKAISELDCYIAVARVAPIPIYSFIDSEIVPDTALVIFSYDTHYHYGILQSAIHEYWAWARGSTLKGDLRYTNTTIFETFPFPLLSGGDPFAGDDTVGAAHAASVTENNARETGDACIAPTGKHNDRSGAAPGAGLKRSKGKKSGGGVAAATKGKGALTEDVPGTAVEDALARPTLNPPALSDLKSNYDPRQVPDTSEAARVSQVAEELYEKRQAACLALNLGLTKLYNLIKGKTPLDKLSDDHRALNTELQDLHVELNNAVCACYGWPEDTWRDENEVLKRLLKLNLALTSDEGMLG